MTGCSSDNGGKILNKLERTFDKYGGYTTDIEMKTIMDNKESLYKMKESYNSLQKYKLEIIEPDDSNGIVIEFEDDKIFLKHATIDQSISLSSVKTFNKELLIGEFFRNLDSVEAIEVDEIDGESYYIFHNRVKDENIFTKEILIWLKKKDFKPHMLHILDEDNNPRVIINYSNFEFTKD